MRVLFATPGHQVHDARFLDAIRSLGHEPVKAIAATPDDLRAALSRVRPDLTHAGPLGTVAHWAGELGARPLVAASWGFDLLLDPPSGQERRLAGEAIGRADALMVDCRAAADVAASLGMPAARTVILPWGIDLADYGPMDPGRRRSTRAGLGWDDFTIVVTVRAHEAMYGVDVAIDGFALAAERNPGLRLIVVGDGALTPSLRARVDRSGMADRVRFLGRLPPHDVASTLAAADVYLSASHVDGTSVSLLEAMATRLPAVVTDIAGNREWVEPDRNGKLFADGDPGSLAAALAAVTGAPDARRGMGEAGRAIVERRADWSRNIGRIDEAYAMAARHAAG